MSLITSSFILDLLALISTIIVVTIAYLKWKMSHWDRVGLPTLSPSFPFGDTKDLFTGKASIGQQFENLYKIIRAKGLKHAGIYVGMKPFYFPADPNIIKHIWQIDFQHFVNHINYINEEVDPLTGHLFNLEDARWKDMRAKLTPTFTSGKLKMMFQTLTDCSDGLTSIMDECATNQTPVEIKDVLSRFTTDVIGSVAFGLDCNSLKDPNAIFATYGKKALAVEGWQKLKVLAQFAVPHDILRAIRFKRTADDVEEFFMKVVKDTVDYREKNKVYRKDFMHLLLQLKNRGTVSDDDKITENGQIGEKALTINEIAAQAFVFFVAGFESSSSAMTFALYELAADPDIQEKLRHEINTVLAKQNNELSYEAIMEMTYLDKVLQETLRKHSPAPFVFRKCTKDYTIPNTSIKLKKGQPVCVSLVGMHNDPEYYPNPEKFDPERFNEENKRSRPPFTFMPFGEGPRICIGLRFAMLQSKVGLTALLKNYKITLNSKTKYPLELERTGLFPIVKGGVWINVEKVN